MTDFSNFSREDLRVIHQALNEVCNGIHFSEGEFDTRLGTTKQNARQIMRHIEMLYNLTEVRNDFGEGNN